MADNIKDHLCFCINSSPSLLKTILAVLLQCDADTQKHKYKRSQWHRPFAQTESAF